MLHESRPHSKLLNKPSLSWLALLPCSLLDSERRQLNVYKRDDWDLSRAASVLPGGVLPGNSQWRKQMQMPSAKAQGRINHCFFSGLQAHGTCLHQGAAAPTAPWMGVCTPSPSTLWLCLRSCIAPVLAPCHIQSSCSIMNEWICCRINMCSSAYGLELILTCFFTKNKPLSEFSLLMGRTQGGGQGSVSMHHLARRITERARDLWPRPTFK